ncbi:hypothetical protein M3J09_004434 [Ascochyta lentis]
MSVAQTRGDRVSARSLSERWTLALVSVGKAICGIELCTLRAACT